jgi:VanZ family protein
MKFLLLIPVLVYIIASLWANFDLFPEDFMQYRWFDDLGHIVVFGSLAVVALAVTYSRSKPATSAITTVVLLAIADEFSQLLLTHRAFAYQDLVMSLVGIGLAYVCFKIFLYLFPRKYYC